jgi:hypothetical protein
MMVVLRLRGLRHRRDHATGNHGGREKFEEPGHRHTSTAPHLPR